LSKLLIDINAIVEKLPGSADVALILGSGLGGFADTLDNAKSVATCDLPGYPVSTVPGHAGRIVVGKIGHTRVIAFQGRIHLYEGYAPEEVVLPVRVAAKAGAKTLIVTNASGAFSKKFKPGDLLLIDDHINLQFRNPLRGPTIGKEPRWPDLCDCYDKKLKELAEAVAREQGISLRRGTLGAVLGPNYETPAEAAMLNRLGADAGCMSTVPEVITAAACGMKVLGISCVTNSAAGISDVKLTHDDVQSVAADASEKFAQLISGVLRKL
jgi:purine-nucleoside phosphorylase